MMFSVKLKLILLVLSVNIFYTYQPIWAANCDAIVAGTEINLTKRLKAKLQDNLLTFASRFKPIYSDDHFNLRVLSKTLGSTPFSAAKIKDQTIENINSTRERFIEMGFQQQSYVEILTEDKPGVFKLGLSSGGSSLLFNMNGPVAYPAGEKLPNLMVPRAFFLYKYYTSKRLKQKNIDERPALLVLPTLSKASHFALDEFLLAHEWAHITETSGTPQNLIWQEARADMLAYLATGSTELIYPEKMSFADMDKYGNPTEIFTDKIRSLTEPKVSKTDEMIPSEDFFHENSELISSTLYRVKEHIGEEATLEFIQWMDKANTTDFDKKVKEISEKIFYQADGPLQKNLSALPKNRKAELSEALGAALTFSELLRSWMKLTQISEENQKAVESLLKEKGL